MSLTPEEADALASLLNQTCSATLSALRSGDPSPAELAPALLELAAQFEPESSLARFLMHLALWLGGTRPRAADAEALPEPFGGALTTMLARVPVAPPPTPGEGAPISRRVLTQLIAATVAARASGDERAVGQLAATLITTQGRLTGEWRETLGPLLENLRLSLGGVAPERLPPVTGPYATLWESAQGLMAIGTLSEAQAYDELLDRLVHNAEFARRARDPNLSGALAQALLDVQEGALAGLHPQIATLVGAIRADLLGNDPAPLVALLDGAELAAWQRLTGEGAAPSDGT